MACRERGELTCPGSIAPEAERAHYQPRLAPRLMQAFSQAPTSLRLGWLNFESVPATVTPDAR